MNEPVPTGPPTEGDCSHGRSHVVDSMFFGHSFSTPASRHIFCDVCGMQRWLDIEAALALSQAEMGMIPQAAADEIARAARLELIDLEPVRQGIRRSEHALVPLLHAMEGACEGGAGEYLHHGATTQDVIDTAQVLAMRDVLDEVDDGLRSLVARLAELAAEHRDTLMIGRTHARPALPTTFGLKVAGWLDELLRHAERLDAVRHRVLVAQLFGGVGTMASFGDQGRKLLETFARRLGLRAPGLSWHVARDRVAEYVAALAMVTATLGRVADEVRLLSRPEFGELEEAWRHGKVGSSTMPHKRNPERLQQVVVLARLTRANASLGLEGMLQEHERDSRGTRLEWLAIPEVSHFTLAAFAILSPIMAGLQVHDQHMASEARRAAEQICSEALMLALGRHLGKQSAHELVYDLSQAAQSHGASLRRSLLARPDLAELLAPGEVDAIFDPARHLGLAGEMVDDTVAAARRWVARWHSGQ